ncbi:response regulator [Sediminimonas qiaohouensis]|uniref:response regulator n=1 Tax=Sediminimonas qiaohouensis TaxID=552061 RepID=UPI0004185A44|nr:response regulator [Sediminimonas qiaohouensis]
MTRASDQSLILVVEDEAALCRDIVEELQEAGYDTLAAADGRQALALLEDAAPDLVLCDITMPGLDGYEVLREMRTRRPELSATPFVFLTALSEPREVIEGKLLGADDYLVKPVDYDLMLATLAARLRQVNRIRTRHDSEVAQLRDALDAFADKGAAQALDLITLGVMLVDEKGKRLHANRTAQEMIAAAEYIALRGDDIGSPDPPSDRALRNAVSKALQAARAGQEKVVGVMLHCAADPRSVSALVCALPERTGDTDGAARVALFLSAPGARQRVPEPLLMDLFGLTPTEARVAAALASSTRAADVAVDLGVSQTTIAFHMRNLFQKTDTNRQADLIALILAGPMMIKSE